MLLFHPHTPAQRDRSGWFLFWIVTPIVALGGFGAMYILSNVLRWSDSDLTYGAFTIAIIALGLAVPYWMLKVTAHAAHLRDHKERELRLKDIPKDQQQLAAEEEAWPDA